MSDARDLVGRLKLTVDPSSLNTIAESIKRALSSLSPETLSLFKNMDADALRALAALEKLQQAHAKAQQQMSAAEQDATAKAIAAIDRKAAAQASAQAKEEAAILKSLQATRSKTDADDAATTKAVQNAQKRAQADEESYARSNKAALQFIQNLAQGNVTGALQSGFNALGGGGAGGAGGMFGGVVAGAIGGVPGLGGGGGAIAGGFSAATLANLSAGVGLLAKMGSEYLEMYHTGQAYLMQISQTRREIGLSADEAAKLRALMVFTQNPNSPFADIIFQQVQANLQNVADLNAGLIKSNPQLDKFIYGLDQLGLSATDASGKAKGILDFTVELSNAMDRLDPAKRAQIGSELGGLFGKDFMAIVNAGPERITAIMEGAVKVNEAMIKGRDDLTAATKLATEAEMSFTLAATNALQPLDQQLQTVKAIALNLGASLLGGGTQAQQAPLWQQLFNVIPGTQWMGSSSIIDSMRGPMKDFSDWFVQNIMKGFQDASRGAMGLGPSGPEAQVGTKVMPTEAPDVVARDRATLDYKMALQETSRAVSAYERALTDADNAEKQRVANNVASIKGFDKTIDSVFSAARAYDQYYKSYNNTSDKIQELEKKANQSVVYYSVNSTNLKADGLKKIIALQDDLAKETARDADFATKLAAKQGDLAKTLATKKGGPTLYQQLQEDIYAAGGTQLQQVTEDIRERKLAERAAELGFKPGQAITTEAVKAAYGKRGLTPSEAQQMADAYENLKALNLGDKEAQFNTVRTAMENFLSTLTGDEQTKFNAGAKTMGASLDNLARSAGLFESAGFVRAMGEAALAAQLAGHEFDKSGDPLGTYAKKMQDFYGSFDQLRDFISGSKNITLDIAKQAGLISDEVLGVKKPKLQPDMTRDEFAKANAEYAKGADQRDLARRIAAGEVSGAEIAQRTLEKQGIDFQSTIKQAYNMSFTLNGSDPTEYLNKAKGLLAEIFASKYDLQLTFDGMDPKDWKTAIQNAITETQTPGFRPPSRPPSSGPGGAGGGMTMMGGIPINMGGATGGEGGYHTYMPIAFNPTSSTDLGESIKNINKDVQAVADANPILDNTKMNPEAVATLNAYLPTMIRQIQPTADANPVDIKSNLDIASILAAAQAIANANPIHVKVIGDAGGPIGPPNPNAGNTGPQGAWNFTPVDQQQNFTPVQNPPNYTPIRDIGGSVGKGKIYKVANEYFVPGQDGAMLNAVLSDKLERIAGSRLVNGRGGLQYSHMDNSTIHVDARGASSPRETVRAVESAAQAMFFSDEPAMRARMERRRRGDL